MRCLGCTTTAIEAASVWHVLAAVGGGPAATAWASEGALPLPAYKPATNQFCGSLLRFVGANRSLDPGLAWFMLQRGGMGGGTACRLQEALTRSPDVRPTLARFLLGPTYTEAQMAP